MHLLQWFNTLKLGRLQIVGMVFVLANAGNFLREAGVAPAVIVVCAFKSAHYRPCMRIFKSRYCATHLKQF